MNNKSLSVLLMIISSMAFSVMGALVKGLGSEIPVFQKIFFRNSVSLIIAYMGVRRLQVPLFGRKDNQKVLFFRGLFGIFGVALNFYAIEKLTLADSQILMRLSPFFVILFAVIFLKEKLKKFHIPVLLIAVTGAIMIIKPQFNLSVLPALAGLGGAALAGGAYTMVRYLGPREEATVIVFYFSMFSVLGSLPVMAANFVMPDLLQFFLLAGTGLAAAVGQITLTFAYKYSRASDVSAYNYSGIIFAVIIGYFFWMEVPDVFTIAGGLLIIVSGLINFIFSGKKSSV